MKLLHSISRKGTEAWLWATVMGGNGQYLGSHNGSARAHAFYGKRNMSPPPLPEGDPTSYEYRIRASRRGYWYPWGDPFTELREVNQRLTPLCGRIKSTSRNPRLSTTTKVWTTVEPWGMIRCQTCVEEANRLGITVYNGVEVNRQDPWPAIPREIQGITPDPISGR